MELWQRICIHSLQYTGKVILPGIGMLHLLRHRAQINVGKGIISPPQEELLFTSAPHLTTTHLEQLLLQIPAFTYQETSIAVNEVSQTSKSAIEEGELRMLPICSLQHDGQHWQLSTLDLTVVSPYQGLPTVNLPGIVPESMHDETQKAVLNTASNRKRSAFWLALLILGLLLLSLYWFIWRPYNNEDTAYYPVFVNQERTNVNPRTIADAESLQVKHTESSVHEITQEGMARKSPTNEHYHIENGVADEEWDSIQKTPDTDEAVEELNQILSNDPCVVVVGAFRRMRNVDKMKERLRMEGYKVYTEAYKGLTRVGVESRCEEKHLDSVLQECRATIEKGAWLLP